MIFPFNLPSPSIWYVLLYVITMLMHVVFMAYVLGGCIMLGVAGLRGMLGRGDTGSAWSPVTRVLKDWMPFALSAAITAGIAPLLFVQILYQREFYTANLLAFHRWMAILPVLIVAFYLLYLLKAHRAEGRTVLQGAIAMLVMACVLFVAWSWVENHVLSLSRDAWPRQYESQAMFYASPRILPRLGFYVASTMPLACLLLAWQLRAGASGVTRDDQRRSARSLSLLAIVTMLVAGVLAWPVLVATLAPGAAAPTLWLGVAIGGAMSAVGGWALAFARRDVPRGALLGITLASGTFWVGAIMAREAARWSVAGNPDAIARHARVGTLSGLVVFLFFALLGVGVIAWIARRVSASLATTVN